jgi:uncharacterized protein YutE (UPF0331/DUF86 family)
VYDINTNEIRARLQFIEPWSVAFRQLQDGHAWNNVETGAVADFAQERLLQLAIELVTDVASYLIDGYIMRDAGSYEDIVEIMLDETVVDHALATKLFQLVQLRKSLQQQFLEFPRGRQHELMIGLEQVLRDFAASVEDFLARPI